MDVPIDVAVLMLLRLLNRLISDEFSVGNFSNSIRNEKERNLHAFV